MNIAAPKPQKPVALPDIGLDERELPDIGLDEEEPQERWAAPWAKRRERGVKDNASPLYVAAASTYGLIRNFVDTALGAPLRLAQNVAQKFNPYATAAPEGAQQLDVMPEIPEAPRTGHILQPAMEAVGHFGGFVSGKGIPGKTGKLAGGKAGRAIEAGLARATGKVGIPLAAGRVGSEVVALGTMSLLADDSPELEDMFNRAGGGALLGAAFALPKLVQLPKVGPLVNQIIRQFGTRGLAYAVSQYDPETMKRIVGSIEQAIKTKGMMGAEESDQFVNDVFNEALFSWFSWKRKRGGVTANDILRVREEAKRGGLKIKDETAQFMEKVVSESPVAEQRIPQIIGPEGLTVRPDLMEVVSGKKAMPPTATKEVVPEAKPTPPPTAAEPKPVTSPAVSDTAPRTVYRGYSSKEPGEAAWWSEDPKYAQSTAEARVAAKGGEPIVEVARISPKRPHVTEKFASAALELEDVPHNADVIKTKSGREYFILGKADDVISDRRILRSPSTTAAEKVLRQLEERTAAGDTASVGKLEKAIEGMVRGKKVSDVDRSLLMDALSKSRAARAAAPEQAPVAEALPADTVTPKEAADSGFKRIGESREKLMNPAEQKRWLEEKVRAAKEKAVDDIPIDRYDEWIADAKNKVLFDVPGDGQFLVYNTKRAMGLFEEAVKKWPTTRLTPGRPSLPSKARVPIDAPYLGGGYENMGPGRFHSLEQIRRSGTPTLEIKRAEGDYLSDGSYLVKKADIGKSKVKSAVPEIGSMRGKAGEIFADAAKGARAELRPDTIESGDKKHANLIFKNAETGQDITFNSALFGDVMTAVGGDRVMGSTPDKAAVIYRGDKPVAVIMPLSKVSRKGAAINQPEPRKTDLPAVKDIKDALPKVRGEEPEGGITMSVGLPVEQAARGLRKSLDAADRYFEKTLGIAPDASSAEASAAIVRKATESREKMWVPLYKAETNLRRMGAAGNGLADAAINSIKDHTQLSQRAHLVYKEAHALMRKSVRPNILQKTALRRQTDGRIVERLDALIEGRIKPANVHEKAAVDIMRGLTKKYADLAKEAGVKGSDGDEWVGLGETYVPRAYKNLWAFLKDPKFSHFKDAIIEEIAKEKFGHEKDPVRAMEQARNYFSNARADMKSRPYGHLESPRLLSDAALARLLEKWSKLHPGEPFPLEPRHGSDVWIEYLDRAAERISWIKNFGNDAHFKGEQVPQKVADALTNMENPNNQAYVKNLFRNIARPPVAPAIDKALRYIRQGQIIKLTFAGIPNLTQFLTNSVTTQPAATIPETLWRTLKVPFDKAARAAFAATGAAPHLEAGKFAHVTSQRGVDTMTRYFLKGVGFTGTELFNALWSAMAGRATAKHYGKKLAEHGDKAWRAPAWRDQLRRLGFTDAKIDALIKSGAWDTVDAQAIADAGFHARRLTQFAADAFAKPASWTHPIMQTLVQFKNFAYNQTAFIYRDGLKEVAKFVVSGGREGMPTNLAKMMVMIPLAGYFVTEAKDQIYKMFGLDLYSSLIEGKPLPAKMAFWAANAGALGIALDAILATRRGVKGAVGFLGGPTASDIAGLWELASTAAADASKSFEDKDLKWIAHRRKSLVHALAKWGASLNPLARITVAKFSKGYSELRTAAQWNSFVAEQVANYKRRYMTVSPEVAEQEWRVFEETVMPEYYDKFEKWIARPTHDEIVKWWEEAGKHPSERIKMRGRR